MTHSVAALPVLVGVITLEYAFRYMRTLLDHELVEWVREVSGRDPPRQHAAKRLRGM